MTKDLALKILCVIILCILISPLYTAVLFLIIWLVRRILNQAQDTK